MSLTKAQTTGLTLIVASVAIGIIGTLWNIYGSFDALATAEIAGIGAVGDSIRNALIFTIAGLVGSIVGALLLIFGRSRSV